MAIYKRKSKKAKNGYTFQVNFEYKDKYGQKQRYTKDGFSNKREAKNHEIEKKQEFMNNIFIIENKTFDEIFNEYIQYADVRKSTIENRKKLYSNMLKERMGHMDISKIDYEFIQNLLNEYGKTYSLNTCKALKSIINLVFVYAYN